MKSSDSVARMPVEEFLRREKKAPGKQRNTGRVPGMDTINIHSTVAVYIQIENHVQFAIASGKLKGGDQLPSVRELSERLEVNPNTIAKSYRDLEVMGLLYTRRGMGVYVEKGVQAKCAEEVRKRTIVRMHEIVAESKAAGMSKKDMLDIVNHSIATDGSPYAPTPAPMLKLLSKSK